MDAQVCIEQRRVRLGEEGHFGNLVVEDQPYAVIVDEIGEDGAVFRTTSMPTVLPVGERGLQFCLPHERQPLWLWGAVSRDAPGQMSIRFTYMPPRARERLRAYVQRNV